MEAYSARLREMDDVTREMFLEQWAEQKGIQKRNIEIAKKLIMRGLTNEEIAEDTGLTLEQIEQLRNETK